MSTNVTSNVVIAAILLLRLAGCAVAEATDNTLNRRSRSNLLLANVLVVGLVIANFLAISFAGKDGMRLALTVAVAYRYAVCPVILALFISVMDTRHSVRMAWALAAGNALLYCTAFLCPLAFSVTNDNRFAPGPLSFVAYVISALLIVQVVILTIRSHRLRHEPGALLPALGVLIVVASAALDSALGFDYTSQLQITTMTIPLACDCFFTWLHMQTTYEYEQARLDEQRTQLAISQIQPHFLYNTLTAIQSLCLSDPESASRVTEELAAYLRQNLSTLSQSGLIPFSQELEHTQTYAQIEMTRFPHIEITFQIDNTDFMLPALSVQPLVENAIRHGVRVREHGIVRVSSHVERGFHVVEVRDNGKGFDVDSLTDQNTNEHIGIHNVRQRVRRMCGGDLRIQSVVDEGTCATLLVPVKGGAL